MSKLMWVLGVLLAAAGIALALLTTFSPGKMQAYGLLPDTAAILFVGGVLSLGLGGVINALRGNLMTVSSAEASIATAPKTTIVEEENAAVKMPSGFGRKAAETTAAVAAAGVAVASTTASTAAETTKSSVADTIAALDEAKADIKKALSGMDSMTAPSESSESLTAAATEPAAAADEEHAEADPALYVVEEKIIRGRPARILSDETVEAETDEGWMRFENLEHLNEYIDSTEEPDA